MFQYKSDYNFPAKKLNIITIFQVNFCKKLQFSRLIFNFNNGKVCNNIKDSIDECYERSKGVQKHAPL